MQEVDLYLSFPSAVLSRQLHVLEQELAIGVISRRRGGLRWEVRVREGLEVGMRLQVSCSEDNPEREGRECSHFHLRLKFF